MSRPEEEIRRITAELQARLAELEAMTAALASGLAAAAPSEEEGNPLGTG